MYEKRISLVLSTLLVAGFLLPALANGDNVLICHVTAKVVDEANNLCQANVIEVPEGAAGLHLSHGDIPVAPGSPLQRGDKALAPCR